ncbi:MAG: hypothetical protein ACI8ZM_002168 [Crocinitomix sp.]|jgi:hypothetical protein
MKRLFFTLICITFSAFGFGQDENPPAEKADHPFRIELEPSSYIAKGWSLLGSYGIDKERNLSVGLYTIASTLPSGLNRTMFWNVEEEDKIRLSFEAAATLRYKIPYFLNTQSNPYIGLFFGWETFTHTHATNTNVTNLSNFFLTPQVGYEIYILKERLYLNPSVRIVYEFGRESDFDNLGDITNSGPIIRSFVWLPSFSIGVRL